MAFRMLPASTAAFSLSFPISLDISWSRQGAVTTCSGSLAFLSGGNDRGTLCQDNGLFGIFNLTLQW
jgi:hypothetical protein